MNSLAMCGLVAFTVSTVLMPLAVHLSKRWGAVSEIGGRNVGQRPIGRLGGLSVVLGIMIGLTQLLNLNSSVDSDFSDQSVQVLGLIFGVLLVGGVGFWDDIRRLPAIVKLFIQTLAAIIAYLAGLKIQGVDLPFFEPFRLGQFALPVTVFWITGVVNAVNFIDGLDGLAGGVVLLASLVNFVAAISTGSYLSAGIMVSVIGSIVGFLLYNWYPAKIYLGDGGAYSLGFLLSTSTLLSPHQKASTGVVLLVPILATGLPIFDTLLTMARRALNRKRIFTPDRGHLHHILLDAGISHRRVVVGMYAVSCVMGSVAITIVLNQNRTIGYTLIMASIMSVVIWSFTVRDNLIAIKKDTLNYFIVMLQKK
jgi:UDP-GlcNAc:undecaprenyl-phosphate GlcNAc-1-phosphate transferase